MSTPWTRNNPFMSAGVNAASRAGNSARGQSVAAAKRQVAATQAEVAKNMVEFWTGKNKSAPTDKK